MTNITGVTQILSHLQIWIIQWEVRVDYLLIEGATGDSKGTVGHQENRKLELGDILAYVRKEQLQLNA